MKFIDLSSKVSELNSKAEETNNLEQNMTKRLLEKYKTKRLYVIETFSNRRDTRSFS